jgi:hypothetical protein
MSYRVCFRQLATLAGLVQPCGAVGSWAVGSGAVGSGAVGSRAIQDASQGDEVTSRLQE